MVRMRWRSGGKEIGRDSWRISFCMTPPDIAHFVVGGRIRCQKRDLEAREA